MERRLGYNNSHISVPRFYNASSIYDMFTSRDEAFNEIAKEYKEQVDGLFLSDVITDKVEALFETAKMDDDNLPKQVRTLVYIPRVTHKKPENPNKSSLITLDDSTATADVFLLDFWLRARMGWHKLPHLNRRLLKESFWQREVVIFNQLNRDKPDKSYLVYVEDHLTGETDDDLSFARFRFSQGMA